MDERQFVLIGQLTKARGLKGEMRVYPLTDFPDQFFKLDTIHLMKGDGYFPFRLINVSRHGKNIFVKLDGISDVDSTKELIGCEIYIFRDQRMELPKDSYYFEELEGFEVTTSGGEVIGHLVDISHYPASDVLVIDREGREVEIPFVRELVPRINLRKRNITVINMPSLWEE